MKRIFCFSMLLFSLAPMSWGQGSPSAAEVAARQEAEENYKSLSAHVDDLLAAQADQQKRLQAMAKEISELRDQSTKPTGNFASQDDLKHLADAIQEIDKKREADKELILHEISKLGKTISTGSSRSTPRPPPADTGDHTSTATSTSDGNQTGYDYIVKKDDTYGVIAQAYREKGIKVYGRDIEKANPGVDPSKLKVGQKIFIPSPASK